MQTKDYPVSVKKAGDKLSLSKEKLRVFPASDQRIQWVSEVGTLELRFVDTNSGPLVESEIEKVNGGRILRLGRIRPDIPVGTVFDYELLLMDGATILGRTLGSIIISASARNGVTITLQSDRTLKVEPDVVWLKAGEQVEWTCNDDGVFTIEFKSTTPFASQKYEGKRSKKSEACKADAAQKVHDYTVTLSPAAGGPPVTLDPGVGVDDDGPDPR